MTKFISDEDIRNRAAYHPPTSPDIVLAHEAIRTQFADLGVFLNDLLPEGPMKTRTINAVMDNMMLANQCIAMTQQTYTTQPNGELTCVKCNVRVFYHDGRLVHTIHPLDSHEAEISE
jgi:hypothetical protein